MRRSRTAPGIHPPASGAAHPVDVDADPTAPRGYRLDPGDLSVTAAEATPGLILDGLGHRYPGRPWLFRGLIARLEPGRSYAVTGPSGSGKSTLLSLLAGWDEPAEGSVIRPAGLRVNWVFQNPHGVARRTAVDHVVVPLLARGHRPASAEAQARDILDEFGLTGVADREFRELSGGEAQRLMLARGIAAAPGLLLVDEPTAQLDRVTADSVNRSLGAVRRGTTTIVVIATHDDRTRDACDTHLDLTADAR